MCGALARLYGRRPSWVPDLPVGGRPVRLCWLKRVWRCHARALDGFRCTPRTWTEVHGAVRAWVVLTAWAKAAATRRLGRDADSVEQVRRDLGVGWATVMRTVVEHGEPLVDDSTCLAEVTAVGVDETTLLAATPTTPTRFVTGLVDLRPAGGGPARLLDVVESRSRPVLAGWPARASVGAPGSAGPRSTRLRG